VENWRNSSNLRFQERVIIIIVIIYSQTSSSALFACVEMMTKGNRSSCKQVYTHTHTPHTQAAEYYKRVPTAYIKGDFFNITHTTHIFL